MHSHPPQLGRSLVVEPKTAVPDLWHDCQRFRIDDQLLGEADAIDVLIADLHRSWVSRQPVVIELAVPDATLRMEESLTEPPWKVSADFSFPMERLLHLIWTNSYDGRRDPAKWWWSVKAERLGAEAGGRFDIILPDGRHAWVDGGPRGSVIGTDQPVVSWESVALGALGVDRANSSDDPADRSGLAADQLEAVEHRGGAARVIAPAGSGKTRTLDGRLRELADGRGIPTDLITAVAYNNRAAAELRGRLPAHLRGTVKTIHALGRAILFSSRGELRLLEERDVRQRLEPLIPVARRPNTDIVGPYIEALSDVRVALRTPDEIEATRDDVPELARVLEIFRSQMAGSGECDFDEFVSGAIEVLLSDPDLRQRWQWSCRHLLVDEFQDLTPGYVLLLRLLAAPTMDVFAVGDDDQVIYGYAGADPAYLIDFEQLFPGAAEFALEANYRCPPAIVDATIELLSYNHRRIDKSIRAHADEGDAGLRVVTPPPEECAIVAVDTIETWLDGGVASTDMVVLCRVNSALLPVHAALVDRGVPFRSPLDGSTLSRTVMAAALAWLRLAQADELNRNDLMTAVRRPSRGLTRLAAELFGRRRTISLADLRELGHHLEGRRADRWDAWCANIGAVQRVAKSGNVGDLVACLISDIGLGKAAASLDAGRTRADRAAQSDDLSALVRLAALHPRLDDFEPWLRSVLAVADVETGVLLTTIHRVKGLEWDRVVVYGADRSLLPHDLADDVEEERRIFHVAITRARKEAVVIGDAERPSRFLRELDGSAPHLEAEEPPSAAGRAMAPGLSVEIGERIQVAGGYGGLVERKIPTGVLLRLDPGPGQLAVTWGETITSDGGRGPLRPGSVQPDAGLIERLKRWRLDVARSGGVPAYVVLTDASIEGLAARRPRSESELLAIKGIGPAKLEAYGDDLLDLCAD